jgi:hypothetical protein
MHMMRESQALSRLFTTTTTALCFFDLAHERIIVEPPEHLISSDEQDPGTTPVTESPSTSTKESSLKKMYLAKIKEFQYGTWKSDMKLKYPMIENM